ncbi:hypothetical protein Nepgr_022270 [Nepenthes gracilis]|uniref:Uncharacterized protein n=1 Tax=Nepenthes gracilis TaxID=150966 RepID=A0AAD3XXW8_NEPGR|nr:hypothetical protein Nepgr_022270 [Nepenthes gracilis]
MPSQLRINAGSSSELPDQMFTVTQINYQWKPKRNHMSARVRSSEVHPKSAAIFRPTGKILPSKEGEMVSKYQTNSKIILSDEMKDDPNGKDCIRKESDDPIPLAWSLSEHQKKPTGLLGPGVESKTKENQSMSQQHPNSGAAFVDNYPDEEDHLDAQGSPCDLDQNVGPPAIGKAPRIGSPSHVVPDLHQGGELSPGTKFD